MSRSNLLKTTDLTFLDLIGNGKKYRVPKFQRDYSWGQEQWEDLWNDILELTPQTSSRHYMGALVTETITDREFQIIDGQQRMATLSLLALAVIDILQSLGDTDQERAANLDRAKRLRERFIGEKDPASLLESSKLFLNEANDAFYQDYLVQLRPHRNPKGLSQSNKKLLECFRWFKSKLEEQQPKTGEWFAQLLSETIGRQLLFILITVEDELSAYVVFETLNARGLELSSTDLLKNYLFSKIRVDSDLAALHRRWQSIINSVRSERFPDFLRYHLLCKSPKVRKQRLFKELRNTIKTAPEVFSLIEELEQRAELFAALNDPEHEYWQENPDAKPYIRELQLFRVQQMTPLLFAAYETLDNTDFVRTLKLVSVISFRYTIISSLNTNALEPTYHEAAHALLTKKITRPAEIFEILSDIYVTDEKFQRDFEVKELSTGGQRKKLVKYILCRLESQTSSRSIDFESGAGTIEHILPEHPASSQSWGAHFPENRHKNFVDRIGNLTLLEASINREIGNADWPVKLARYQESQYDQTRAITNNPPEEWTPSAIEARQRDMAKKAVHIWRSDFA